jgi:hypothetical protein
MTQQQAATGSVLEDLGFSMESAMPGAEPKYEITAEIVDKFTKNKGKNLVVANDGSIRIE